MMPTPEEIDDACRKLREFIDKPMTPREGKIIAKFDQIRAECRDPAIREAVIEALIEQGATREDAEEWVDQA